MALLRALAVFLLILPAGAFAAGDASPSDLAPAKWTDYSSTDGSFSFRHPVGWDVTRNGDAFRIFNPARRETALIHLWGGGKGKSLEESAKSVITRMRQSIGDSFEAKAAGVKGGRAYVRFSFAHKGKAVQGLGYYTEDKSGTGTWYAYMVSALDFSVKRATAVLGPIAKSTVRRRKGPNVAADPAPPYEATGPGEGDDPFFRSGGKTLSGLYRGILVKEILSTHLETGNRPPGSTQANRQQTVAVGDFEAGFYPDGTVRARFTVVEHFGTFSLNRRLYYEGPYDLTPDGTLGTGNMTRVDGPKDGEFKDLYPSLRLQGRYEREQDSYRFPVVEYFDPDLKRWERWDFTLEKENKGGMLLLKRVTGKR